MTDIGIRVVVSAQDAASAVLRSIGNGLQSWFNALPGLAKLAVGGFTAVTGLAIGLGVASVDAAAKYQQAMNMVQALTGSSSAQMSQYDAQLKALAINAGVAPTALASGLYNVLSASYKGADAMRVLTLATEDSKIGMTSATVTTDALTNVLRSFGTKSQDITRVNGEMLETVTLGKATFEQYAQAIVKAASSSVQFHVSMETMNAAWATMTSSGIRAAQASTDFQQSLKVMYGNIGTVATSLHKNGIAFDEAKFNAMSYGDKIVYLNQALQQANEKHVKVTGVTIQAAQAVSTIARHIGDYNKNLATLSNKQEMAKKTQEAWNITQGGFAQTMSRLQAGLQVILIDIGQQLLPVLTRFAQQLLPIIQNLATWIQQSGVMKVVAGLLSGALSFVLGAILAIIGAASGFINFLQNGGAAATLVKVLLIALGGAILGFIASTIPPLIASFWAWAVAAGAAAIATLAAAWPFILVGAIVALVVVGIILAIQHWGQIVSWLRGVWTAFSSWFGGLMSAIGTFFHAVWTKIADFFVSIWRSLVANAKTILLILLAVITGPIGWLMIFIVQHWTQIKDFLSNAWQTIQNLAKTAWANLTGGIVGQLASLWVRIQTWFATLKSNALQWGRDFIQNLINGIVGMIGNVAHAAQSVAQNIAKFLHFSRPEAGPLASVEEWMPHMTQLLTQGLQKQAQVVGSASLHVAQTMAAPMAAQNTSIGAPASSSTTNNGGINVIINMSAGSRSEQAKAVADEVLKVLSRELRRSGNMVTWTSGGRS
jgi:TP901 family phage tail tape measure protein